MTKNNPIDYAAEKRADKARECRLAMQEAADKDAAMADLDNERKQEEEQEPKHD